MQKTLLWIVAVVALALSLAANIGKTEKTSSATASPDIHARVVASSELRVGYLVYPPYLAKDSSSSKLSGVFFDLTEQLGRNLGLKVTWVEEVNLANLATGFSSQRYDMIAFPLWRSASRAKAVAFSVPLFYSVIGAYVRKDDARFDGNLSLLNAPSVTVAAIDGELAADIAKSSFPAARIDSKPQLASYEQLLLEVDAKKADVTFFNRLFANRFIAKNPGKIKDVSAPDVPIRVLAETFILPPDSPRFNAMIDNALIELLENGGLESALEKNGENPSDYFRRSLPFRQPSTTGR